MTIPKSLQGGIYEKVILFYCHGGMEPVTYEYDGKIYNFCCTSCVDEFKKEPQKYIQKVKEELKTAKQQDPAEKTDMNKKDEMSKDIHGGHNK